MPYYISTKMTQAHYKLSEDDGLGYLVRSNDNSLKWMSKPEFERIYAYKLENGKSITETDISNFIASIEFLQAGKNVLLARATLRNGGMIVESHSYLNPSEFNKKDAIAVCQSKIHDKIRFLLTFLLRCTQVEVMPFYPWEAKPILRYHEFP